MATISRKKPTNGKRARRKAGRTVPLVKESSTSTQRSAVLDLRKHLQLNQAIFARLLPVSVRSLATLESGGPRSEAVNRRLSELRRLAQALSEVMKNESIGSWLQTPNGAFGGLKPLEVIDRGESDRIWSMLYFLRSGVAT